MKKLALAVVAASLLLLTGCQSGLSDTGEPLTVEQSESLAQTRFQLASRGDTVLEISALPADDVSHIELTVTFDPVDHLAWGTMRRGPEGIAVEETVAFSPETFAVEGESGWQSVPLDSGPNRALAVVFALGADRPENAQLLRQSDAMHLGAAELDGETLQVFRAPSIDGSGARTRLWLDDDGRLRRLDAGDDEQLVIVVSDAEPQPRPPGLDVTGGSGG